MWILERGKCKIPGCNCIVDIYRVKNDEWRCFDLCQKHRKLSKKEHIIDKYELKEVDEFNKDGKPLCTIKNCYRVARTINYNRLSIESIKNLDDNAKTLLKKLGIKEHNRGKLCEFHARGYDQYSERLKKKREYTRVARYKISKNTYKEMWDKQEGKCKICGENLVDADNKTHIDHNHATGKVTALLCRTCNLGIGMLKYNKDIVKSAMNFISDNYT